MANCPTQPAYPAALTDFVIADLCGTPPSSEPTNAGAHCLFDLTRGQWHSAIIERLGLSRLHWHEVRPWRGGSKAEIAGQTIPCYSTVGDHQCALLGAFLARV